MTRGRNFSDGPSPTGGFTIVEVMMASTILVVGFIGIIQAITIGSEMLDTSRKQLIAQQIINGEIAHLRMSSWGTVTGLPASASITVNATGTAASGSTAYFELDTHPVLMAVAPDFTCSFTKTWIRTNYYRVTYTVTWKSNTGRTYSRRGEACFGLNGLQLSYQKV